MGLSRVGAAEWLHLEAPPGWAAFCTPFGAPARFGVLLLLDELVAVLEIVLVAVSLILHLHSLCPVLCQHRQRVPMCRASPR